MLSDETKRKISESLKGHIAWNKGKPHSAETRAKISAKAKIRFQNIECHPAYGRHCSEETREKIRKSKIGQLGTFTGRHHSEEAKDKMRQARLGKPSWNKGCLKSEETKRKLSLALVGRPRSEASRLKQSKTYKLLWANPEYREKMEKLIFGSIRGKGHSEETRQKISTKLKERLADPTKNPNWQGGISFEPYPPKFNEALKESIRERDNHTCQKCGVSECECFAKLDIHHIDYDKTNCLPSNLVSLCHSCNGQVNANRKRWQKIFEASGDKGRYSQNCRDFAKAQ
jgi:hypothetical protein